MKAYNWVNVAFFCLSPLAACIGVGWHTYQFGLHRGDLLSFGIMFCATGLAVNAGYHQYYSHRSYECHHIVQVFYLLFGAAAIQNSVLCWASNHRDHHRFVDQRGDPYNINKGFFWAHMGWTFYENKTNFEQRFANVPDLLTDRLTMWQYRHGLLLGLGFGFALPLMAGIVYGRPGGSLLWGGLLRMVIFHHITFLVNSAGHSVGSQPYSDANSSRDNWWLAILMFGGGYHNFHHTFPGDYRNGVTRYPWDPATWWIRSLHCVGLTWRLHKAPQRSTLQARMRMAARTSKPVPTQPSERTAS